jgi:hypothetical protein
MALITETGSGACDSESYASVAQADDYHAKRGATLWSSLQVADKEAALRRASDYVTEAYRQKWKGARTHYAQALDWPRFGAELDDVSYGQYAAYVDPNSVPQQVINATCELAFRAAQGPLADDIDGPRLISKTIGPIKKEYAATGPEHKRYRSIDMLLRPLLSSGGGNLKIVRA